jgi:hypothetical protein
MQSGFGFAGKVEQRLIDFLNRAATAAHQQDVRHGSQHADNELLRFLQRGILLLQRHFVLEQIVVDLIHLLDHIDPGLFANASQRRRTVGGQVGMLAWRM